MRPEFAILKANRTSAGHPRRGEQVALGSGNAMGANEFKELVGLPPSPRNVAARSAFTLVEMMVVIALLSLIVVALMAVFSSTQRAFRASVTQTDVLGNGRATVNLIASDLRGLRPSDGISNLVNGVPYGPVNFAVFASAGDSNRLGKNS